MFKKKAKFYYVYFIVSWQQFSLQGGQKILNTHGNIGCTLKEQTIYSYEIEIKGLIKSIFEKQNTGARVMNITICNVLPVDGQGDYKEVVQDLIAKEQSN